MKQMTEQLLDDMLEDAAPPAFRAVLLKQTLGSARRRKQARHFKAALTATAAFGIFLFLSWHMRRTVSLPGQIPQPVLTMVNSQPLEPEEVITTQVNSVEEIASSPSSVAEIRTSQIAGAYELINDQQLLALLSDKSAAVIYRGPHEAELIFFNAEK